MCGIAGLIGYRGDTEANVRRMCDSIAHRGPDADGFWRSEDGEAVFGHRRLAVVDLTPTGAQPMTSHSGRFTIVYNGEIYNYQSLKERLLREKRVAAFRGTSDTEVLLEAIEAWGLTETLRRSKGMFAIALYDRKERTVCLARDRIGEKPLYYGYAGDAFAFASEIGCFLRIEGFRRELRRDVLPVYLAHGYIPAPYSIFRNVFKLQPGRILTVRLPYAKERPVRETAYWSLEETALNGVRNPFSGSRAEAAEELERLLKNAIREQMVADVPVGAFLSAGIDSSAVVALMQSLHPGRVKTFTIGFEDPGYNEAEDAARIAAHLGTEHTQRVISETEAKEVIPRLAEMFGEPFADSSQIPTFLVSRMTREQVTVSLSGDAGDELFCGYRSYASVERIWNKIRGVPYALRRSAGALLAGFPGVGQNEVLRDKAALLQSKNAADLYRRQYLLDPLTSALTGAQRGCPYAYEEIAGIGMENGCRTLKALARRATPPFAYDEVNHEIMRMDLAMYHPDDILVKVDRAAMAVSLETRVPMLDRDVVEFAWTLPVAYLRNENEGKLVLRDVLYRYVPRTLMERPKKGFSVPVARWLREPELREWAEELLRKERIAGQGYLNAGAVRRIWEDFTANGVWRVQIWYLLMFEQWMEEYGKTVSV